MKLTTISHPLKTIHLEYVSEAPLSEFESNFIVQYRTLHDEVLQMKEKMLELRSAIAKKKEEMKVPAAGYNELKKEIRMYEKFLGLTGDDAPDESEFTINPHLFQLKLDDYRLVMDQYWAGIETLHDRYHAAFTITADFDKLFEAFERQYEKPLFKNYESMEIDIVSFDADLNAFRDKWNEIYTLFENTVDEYEVWLKRHNKMATDINALYKRIKKLFGWIAEMQQSNKGKEGGSFSDN
jgi:hypothetical protein